ncbi:MAG: GNAT family N-acetyltransferase [Gemmataceae bacterium]|nr:GNAT family N-acetyltransferase [Gemmataceae bacterium]
MYDPAELVRLNQTEAMVSVVAIISGTGEVVGHFALERIVGSAVAEVGEAIVLAEHRHRHLMEAMLAMLEDHARGLGLAGIFAQPVTNHLFSQKANERCGFRSCGVTLGVLSRAYRNTPEPQQQRGSLLLDFKYLQPPTPAIRHVPLHHQAIAARIYEMIHATVDFGLAPPATGSGRLVSKSFAAGQVAGIRVLRVGTDSAEEVARARRDLERAGAQAVILELPLAQSGTPALCQALEAEGFSFIGIGPCFAADGDVLRLQTLTEELDFAVPRIETPFARELLAYAASQRKRIIQPREYHPDQKGIFMS